MGVEGGMRVNTPHGGEKHLCQRCRDRKALFQHRGRVRADRHHTLCFECYRSERERQRAHTLADPSNPPKQPSLFADVPDAATALTPSQVAHRRRMLRNLEGRPPAFGSPLARAGGEPA